MSRIDLLRKNYQRICNLPWDRNVAGPQRVWFAVYDKEDERKLRFPLLSDFEPKGDAARLYGAYRDDDGTSERALFVIDGDGVIRWSYCSPVGVNPGADGILRALEALKAEATHG